MKNLFAIICTLCFMLSIALPGHAGGVRPSFSARPSFGGGFRPAPVYRSFSPSPSRSFTFKSSPVATPRPATTTPTYHYNAPVKAQPISRSTTTKRTVINNHYHGESGHSGGGGLSLMDFAILHSLTNHNNSPAYVSTPPTTVVTAQPAVADARVGSYEAPAVIYQQEESHFWRNFFLFVIGCGAVYGVFRFYRHLSL